MAPKFQTINTYINNHLKNVWIKRGRDKQFIWQHESRNIVEGNFLVENSPWINILPNFRTWWMSKIPYMNLTDKRGEPGINVVFSKFLSQYAAALAIPMKNSKYSTQGPLKTVIKTATKWTLNKLNIAPATSLFCNFAPSSWVKRQINWCTYLRATRRSHLHSMWWSITIHWWHRFHAVIA